MDLLQAAVASTIAMRAQQAHLNPPEPKPQAPRRKWHLPIPFIPSLLSRGRVALKANS